MKDIENEIKNIMAETFNVSVEQIEDDSSPNTIQGWDSLTHINLVLALQKEFDIKFEDEEIPTLVSTKMIVITVEGYLE